MSVWFRPAAAARQPAPAFSRDEIARAAIDLADQGGLEAVSMRRIAARIGSAPTSLYWYVSNKDELYELMIDAVLGLIPVPDQPSGDWRGDLTAIARAARATLSAHPWFAQLGIHPVAGPQTLRFSALSLRSFEGLGLDPDTETNILGAVNNYVYGFVQREAAWQRLAARPEPAAAPRDAQPAETGGAGPYTISAEHLAVRTKLHGDASFEFGLDCLLDGIADRIAQVREQAG
ncbi:MAG: TetR/AcrR family transcriptional regulator [Streptosporangiaceae bacterium]